MIKSPLASILPIGTVVDHPEYFETVLPDIGQSLVIPIVAPIVSLFVTYTANVIYKFIVEQKDKNFLTKIAKFKHKLKACTSFERHNQRLK